MSGPSDEEAQAQVNARHQAISAYFLGPRAENANDFKEIINGVIDQHIETRKNFQKQDKVFLSFLVSRY